MNNVLFWDFDGTLVHANDSFYLSLSGALEKNGFSLPEADLRTFLKASCSWHIWEHTYPEKTGFGWWETMFQRCREFFTRQGIPASLHDTICRDYRLNNISYPYTVHDDAQFVLQEALRRGYRNYLISNNYPELPEVMERVGLIRYFDGLFVSANVGYDKPQPEIFRRAMQAAGNPDRCFMIGDNPIADIQGAKAMGMETVLVHRPGPYEADHHCDTLEEILSFLDGT